MKRKHPFSQKIVNKRSVRPTQFESDPLITYLHVEEIVGSEPLNALLRLQPLPRHERILRGNAHWRHSALQVWLIAISGEAARKAAAKLDERFHNIGSTKSTGFSAAS